MADDGATDQLPSRLDVRLAQDGPIPLDVTLSCADNCLLALIGPSGSGKTTILRTIAGLRSTTHGQITVGADVWLDTNSGIALSPQQRRTGLVFQDYALFPHLSALETVALAAPGPSREHRRAIALEWLQRVNLDGLGDRLPAQLSGGQQQRVALARALAREPRVLLLDEPFSSVDHRTRERLKEELATLRGTLACPIILVTHDLEEAMALADRIGVLSRGRTLQIDTPEVIMSRPASRVVARLTGQTNIFDGSIAAVSRDGATGRLDWAGGTLDIGDTGRAAIGQRVTWMLPADAIVLHRRGRPSFGERENPVAGRIARLIRLGEQTAVVVTAAGAANAVLNFRLPTHAARRNELAEGADVMISLLAGSLHIMGDD